MKRVYYAEIKDDIDILKNNLDREWENLPLLTKNFIEQKLGELIKRIENDGREQ